MKRLGYIFLSLILVLGVSGRTAATEAAGSVSGNDLSVQEEAEAAVSGNDLPVQAGAETETVGSGNELPAPEETEAAVSGNDLPDDGVVVPLEELPEGVISLQVPECLDFIMDPYELCGRGQIFSKEYSFYNQGSQAVHVKLSAMRCIGAEGVVIVGDNLDAGAITESTGKTIRLQLLFENEKVITVTEEPVEYEMTLEPGQKSVVCITGNMSCNPQGSWNDRDVILSLVYDAQILQDGEAGAAR